MSNKGSCGAGNLSRAVCGGLTRALSWMQGSLDALFIRSSGLNDKTDLWEVHSGQEAQPANSFIRLTVVQMVERNTIGFA